MNRALQHVWPLSTNVLIHAWEPIANRLITIHSNLYHSEYASTTSYSCTVQAVLRTVAHDVDTENPGVNF
jgi:hypothetical protein